MVTKFKEKKVHYDSLSACQAEIIATEIRLAREEKVNLLHFLFGEVSKVSFDVVIYPED